MFYENDIVIKQKLIGDLNKYLMSQKQVAEFLGMSRSNLSSVVSTDKLRPLYVFDHSSSRKMALFYKKDVELYSKNRRTRKRNK
ncbi:DNA-binding protein [Listeria sp. SHR_NRA_18]|uniref:hypothetical protein n=1 Tax=Listeria TaxID=1637 RepID=UPI00098CF6F3|nr:MULTISPECIES: hypothetical protein [Listeria]RQW68109.1 DNA-binding protein [Listeria sp. SHR_NRA_18]WAO21122.2 DNA-binding protein [Listeria newyorkensis]